MSIRHFCNWVSTTPISQTLQTVAWIIPVVQSIHILSIAIVLSSILIVNLRVLGAIGQGETLAVFSHRYLPWIWVSLGVLLVSGITLIVGEPRRELLNPIFWTKMALLVCVIAITLQTHRPLLKNALFWEPPRRKAIVRGLACVALACWVGIVFCGRWIAYTYEP
jgi:hypothetical protein